MKNNPLLNWRIFMFVVFAAALLGVLIGTSAQADVQVDADDVVKIIKVVNYEDKTGGRVYPGAKMNIIVFKRER